jgi:Putative auto-transporter adhesin, head GIN domain
MKRVWLLAVLCIGSASAASTWKCGPGSFGTGPGTLKIEERTVASSFNGIAVRNGACVEYVQGPTVSIKIEARQETLDMLELSVERESLVIGDKKGSSWTSWTQSRGPVRVLVTAPSIERLAVAGHGDLYAASLEGDRIKLSVAGSGDILLPNMQAKSVTISVAGSGDVRVGGKTQSAKVSVAGSGDIDATRLEAVDASVSVAGSGDAKMWVTNSLAVSVAGSGTVAYYGNPQLTSRTAGSATLKRLGDKP